MREEKEDEMCIEQDVRVERENMRRKIKVYRARCEGREGRDEKEDVGV